MLNINNLTFRMMGRPLFEDASATIPTGSKCGLVGRNGTGKTTLFKLINGTLSPESGDISLQKGLRLGQVAQEAPGTDATLLETVLEADTERTALLEEAETATDPNRISEIHIRLADIEAHSAEARAGAILHGLGFDAEAQQRPCSSFSGGWRMRVALAAVLFLEPDYLLLDEPTNYLDLEGTLWLENYIQRYPHTVFIISHDRDLLNSAATSILHLENKQLTLYRGNYDNFARTRAERMSQLVKSKEKQDAKKKHMAAFVERFRAKASKAKQAQSRLKALEKMGDISIMVDESVKPIVFPSPTREAASPIVTMESARVGYDPDKPILTHLNLRIDADDRIALLGANGNGKSTFAKLLSDRLQAQEGTVVRADKLRVAMFAQHQMDDLHSDWTAFDHLRAALPEEPESRVRARVAAMGLGTDKMDTKAAQLSGGERARLTLGLATLDKPHLLILDEPTNHLDIDSRAALIEALNGYSGAVMLISHDRHLLEATAERLWIVGEGTVKPYEGDMDEYRTLILKGPQKKSNDDDDAKKGDGLSGKERRKLAAQARQKMAPVKKKINHIEGLMAKATKEIQVIDESLGTKAVLDDQGKVSDLTIKRGKIEKQIADWEAEWIDLCTQYEEATGTNLMDD
ncbi:ribosomal protection-like ABC-F family protein [Ahrensia kielensis]|uniref:ABC-F family ATP-binding cassette domain-containing protein n=1 Tax=Ahrensia kielensis TaxID=76980 RepID=A0ABU9T340_9HYPH|nr:ABC-F family ATP-binding cassette domain-containing protein [Ahrensia kielensis]